MTKTYGNAGRRNQNSRPKATRKRIPRVLIVCEGEKTEPGYFKLFRIHPRVREIQIHGEGKNTLSLVKEAEEIVKDEGPFDAVWCVFDRDSFPPDDYDNAIEKAEAKGYKAAYSNEAFELWFVLHFGYLNTALDRNQYKEKLTTLLGQKYVKNDPELYRLIQQKGDEEQAIERAKKLLVIHQPQIPYSQRCPCTNVHLLVEQLRKWERESKP